MENNYLKFSQIILIYLLLLVSFILVHCPFETEVKFTNWSCYESFSIPKAQFKIYHNNPTGPRFLIIQLSVEYVSKFDILLKKERRTYHLKQKNGACDSSFVISTMWKQFYEMYISGDIYLYFNESSIATFIYKFNNIFNSFLLKLIDSKNNFGLLVEFSKSINATSKSNEVKSKHIISYLNTLEKYLSICLLTKYNRKLILYPQYMSNTASGLITGVEVEYSENGVVWYSEKYPAFECQEINTKHMERVFLIKDGNEYDTQINVIYWEADNFTLNAKISQIFIMNGYMTNIEETQDLPSNINKFFLFKTFYGYTKCSDGKEYYVLISKSGLTFYAERHAYVEINYGIMRYKWISHSINELC